MMAAPREQATRDPAVSVVIPTYQRPDALRRCLAALARQEFPSDRFEVIVVDDGSALPAAEVVHQYEAQLPVCLLVQSNRGPAAARNAGAARARGQLLAFTDDDCQPHPGWLERLVQAANEEPGAAIGGRTINALDRNAFSTASQILIDYLYEVYNQPASPREPMFTSNNLAMPTAGFREIGGFPTDFTKAGGEDRELCARWHHGGRRMLYAPSAVIDHHHDLTFASFVRQHFVYGRGAYLFRHKQHGRGREHRLEPLRFYRNLLLYPFGRMPFLQSLRITALLCVSQAANALGFFWELRAQR